MRLYPIKLLIIISLLLSIATTALANTPAGNNNQLDSVVLQLRWLHQFQFAGYYAAIEQGYYKDVGLQVEINEGGPGVNTIKEVIDGKAHYGVTNSEVLLQRLKGKPVVVLAAIFQHSPLALVIRQSSGITNPQELKGHNIILSQGTRDVEIKAMLLNEGINLKELNIVKSFTTTEDYTNPAIDSFPVYTTNQPFFLEREKVTYSVLKPSTYGIDFYGDCLFTSVQELENNPERVKAFRKASLKGWEYAMEHPALMVDFISNHIGSRKSKEHLIYEANAMRELILPTLVEIGHMNPGRWEHMAKTFANLNMIDAKPVLSGFIYDPAVQGDTYLRRNLAITIGAVVLFAIIATVLLIFNRRFKHEINERIAVEQELSESEKRFRTLFEKSAEAMLIIKGETFVDCNEATVKLFGCENKECVIKAHQSDLSPKYQPDGRSSIEGAQEMIKIAQQQGSHQFEWTHKRPNGELFPAEITLTAISIGDTKLLHTVLRDISAKKKAEAEKQEMEFKLNRAHKMEAIGMMAGGVAHDLNNMLAGVINYPELMLLKLPTDSELRRPLEAIRDSGQRAAAVVADLLTVARGVASTKKPCDINLLIKEHLKSPECKLLRTSYSEVEFTEQYTTKQPIINCSAIHIKKALMNLTMNAAEAVGDKGNVIISTRIHQIEQAEGREKDMAPGDYVSLTVQDNGSGITDKDLKHIFEPFYTRKMMGKSGTGLGLAVVWNTVQDHNGKIFVESSPEGTRFQLYFPSEKKEIIAQPATDSRENLISNNEHILIVDDEQHLRDIACQILQDLNYRVDTVGSGEQAIDFVKDTPVDLIVLDMLMEPGINGRQTYAKIIEQYPNQKAIIASGFSKSDDVKIALQLGASEFIGKPYSREQLGRAVKDVLNR